MLNPYGRYIPEFEKRGPHKDFWILHAEIVEKIINANKLRPLSTQYHVAKLDISEKTSSEQAYAEWWLKYGGIRVPHLHYNGEIYLLNKKQWAEFSGEIIKDFSRKLSEAKTVNFGQLMELSDAVNEII